MVSWVKDQGVGHVAHLSEQALGHEWPRSSSPHVKPFFPHNLQPFYVIQSLSRV